ncbi:hypothetical protein EMCRGX_G001546 [Ephydatia muelleri]
MAEQSDAFKQLDAVGKSRYNEKLAKVTWPSFLSTTSYKRPFLDERMDFNVLFGPRGQILLPSWKYRTKGNRRLLLLVHLFEEVIRDGFILPQTNSNIGMEMVLSGLVAASLLSTCDAIFTSSLEEHSTFMSCRSTMMIGGAGFSADGNKGASTKQQGHFTLLQLKTSNHLTIHVVHTSALHAELFKVLSGISATKRLPQTATFLELVSVEFHLGLCDRTKQLQPHYS